MRKLLGLGAVLALLAVVTVTASARRQDQPRPQVAPSPVVLILMENTNQPTVHGFGYFKTFADQGREFIQPEPTVPDAGK